MNDQVRAFQISFLIHAVLVALAVMGGAFSAQHRKAVVLDFDLLPPAPPIQKIEPMPQVALKPVKPASFFARKEKEASGPIKENPRISSVPETPPIIKPPETLKLENSKAATAGLTDSGKSFRDGISGIAGGTGEGNGKSPGAGNTAKDQESARASYLNEHFAYIRDKILRNVVYPDAARRMGWQGKVILSFVITAKGAVKSFQVVQSSGFKMLDRNAVETVQDAAPFPRPPVEAKLVIPIIYRLN